MALSGPPFDYENLLTLLVDSLFIQLDNQHTMDFNSLSGCWNAPRIASENHLTLLRGWLDVQKIFISFSTFFFLFSFLTMFSLLALSLNSEHFVSALKLDWIIWMDGIKSYYGTRSLLLW
jgi:hypothetical protein